MIHTVPSPAEHPVVSREEWLEARKALLAKEKEETRLRDEINGMRLALPWVKIEKNYVFDTPNGRRSLADLFDGRSQLIIYHFMLGPDWEAGCDGCSFLADHIDGALPHLNNHDVTMTAVSRAPLAKIAAYKSRMSWRFPWVSSHGSDFNFDFNVSFDKEHLKGEPFYNFRSAAGLTEEELPGLSAFYKNEAGEVFHTYSSYARGPEELIGALMILDRAPLGRNETTIMNWVRRHDEYEAKPAASCCHAA
ncbi:MAG TPA: thioredoxin family protein [Alphaproteobacteria bacterium]|nr:thioredoxin family protein [Alphaproteobacteria bacterium]